MEFKSFNKILHIGKLYMSITQKIHGSNAQIYIKKNDDGKFELRAGSRNKWLTVDDDNYRFAKFCEENKEELIEKLGEGRHFGEWAGNGINTGEGLQEKIFVLFDWRRFAGKNLPNRVTIVPLLYRGNLSLDAINIAMEVLKEKGSWLVPGYMKPEGIVIEIDGQFYKNVFDEEETKWNEKTKSISTNKEEVDISHLLQPIRLEKLLSRDENYLVNYPKTLGSICRDYVNDLEAEGQFISKTEDDLKVEKKALSRQLFYFIKSICNTRKL